MYSSIMAQYSGFLYCITCSFQTRTIVSDRDSITNGYRLQEGKCGWPARCSRSATPDGSAWNLYLTRGNGSAIYRLMPLYSHKGISRAVPDPYGSRRGTCCCSCGISNTMLAGMMQEWCRNDACKKSMVSNGASIANSKKIFVMSIYNQHLSVARQKSLIKIYWKQLWVIIITDNYTFPEDMIWFYLNKKRSKWQNERMIRHRWRVQWLNN